MSELTQVELDGDTSSILNWQPASEEEKDRAKEIWNNNLAKVKNVDPDSSLGAKVLKFYRRFWGR